MERTPRVQDSSYTLPELTRPLRPLWITPASACFPHVAPDASLLPIICVSASRAVDEGTERRTGGFSYVQGSGDDHELWGQVRYYIRLDRSRPGDDDDGVLFFFYWANQLIGKTHLRFNGAGSDPPTVLAAPRRIVVMLPRRARGGRRQARRNSARNGRTSSG